MFYFPHGEKIAHNILWEYPKDEQCVEVSRRKWMKNRILLIISVALVLSVANYISIAF
jgi:hypothetical protein